MPTNTSKKLDFKSERGKNRVKKLYIRFSPEEFLQIQKHILKYDITASSFIRHSVLFTLSHLKKQQENDD